MDPLQHLATEARNPASHRLDELAAIEIVDLMVGEDRAIADAVATQRTIIAKAIDVIADRIASGGRLIYIGAGTSGRLGVLDASECPPTFQTPHGQVVGLIAGGPGAMFQAVEGAEDSQELGGSDLDAIKLSAKDVLVGIATSGRTPYVIGGAKYARGLGAYTIGLVCTHDSHLAPFVDLLIAPIVGPEVVTGSTRLKAGTATKMVLNMLTTGAMVRLGKTFGNLMVDLKASNQKLVARSNRIVRTVTGVEHDRAAELLKDCNGEVKTAIVSQMANLSAADARAKLAAVQGRVRLAIGETSKRKRADLVLGIDGGGTHTTCLLAEAASGKVLGRATAGPSNIQSVGVNRGLHALDTAIDRAFFDANLARATVGAACVGLAGVDRKEGLDILNEWAERVGLAGTVTITNDAALLLAAGTSEGWGLAVIAGTGSIAYVKSQTGSIGRCGGWGYLLGDEGSAYQIALKGLRAACRAHDGVGPGTTLMAAYLKKMNLSAAPDLIPTVYRGTWDRAAIAGLAPLVLGAAAAGDAVAKEIVTGEAGDLARTAAGAVKSNSLKPDGVPLALAGGLLLGNELFRDAFLQTLKAAGISPGPITHVPDPGAGSVLLARRSIHS